MGWSGRGLTLGFVLALGMVVGVGAAAFRTNTRVRQSADWQAHTIKVSGTLSEFLASLHEADSDQRGYLITGDEPALQRYRAALAGAAHSLEAVRALVADNPVQQPRAAGLRQLLDQHTAGLELTIASRRRNELGAVEELVRSGRVLRVQAIERLAAEMAREELALLGVREANLRDNVRQGALLAVGGALASALLLGVVFLLLWRQLLARRRVAADAESGSRLLRSIVDSLADGLVVADREGQIILVNPAVHQILGRPPGKVAPDNWGETFRFYRPGATTAVPPQDLPLGRAVNGQTVDDEVLILRGPAVPEPLHLSATARPLRDGAGRPAGGVAVFRDITGLHRAAEALRLAKEAAEQASLLKGQFVANVSHELRTPLNGVVGMIDLLADTELSEEQKGFLEVARLAAASQLTLIDDVLDFSKLDAHKMALERVGFSLRRLIEEVLGAHALPAHRKQLELTGEVAPDLPDQVVGNPTRLTQVLTNLVGNAVKFTARGEVTIKVEREPGPGLRLRVRVSDTGVGIAEDKQEMIFHAFSQEDGSTTRRFGGTGLGLTIARELVRLMGGNIAVHSLPGQGSTFAFTVSLGEGASRSAEPAPERAGLRGRRVLVVDDHQTTRRLLEGMLSGFGMLVEPAADAASALKAARQALVAGEPSFALYLVDSELPGSDRLALAGQLRALPGAERIPLVALTSSARAGAEAEARRAGAVAWVTKPVRQAALLEALGTALGLSGPEAGLPEAPPPPVPVPALEPMSILLAEDNPFNQAVARHTLERRGHRVTIAPDGEQAVALAGQDRYDLILMDVQMPAMDGLQATSLIRRQESRGAPRVPIIAMTARAMPGDAEICLAAGMDGYLSKPLRPRDLWAEIERVVTARRAAAEGVEHTPGNGSTGPAVWNGPSGSAVVDEVDEVDEVPLDGGALLAEAGGDRALLGRLVTLFHEQVHPLVADLERAVETGAAPRVEALAHALKSLVGHWRRDGRAFRAAASLEAMGRQGALQPAGPVYDELRISCAALERDLTRMLESERTVHG